MHITFIKYLSKQGIMFGGKNTVPMSMQEAANW